MPHPLVVHCKRQRYDVYIGRPSKWGNPFKVDFDMTREDAIAMYKQWITNPVDEEAKWIAEHVGELKGKVLGCWCAPKACHGDVLARIANGEEDGGSTGSDTGVPVLW